jgi:hypothetical protein
VDPLLTPDVGGVLRGAHMVAALILVPEPGAGPCEVQEHSQFRKVMVDLWLRNAALDEQHSRQRLRAGAASPANATRRCPEQGGSSLARRCSSHQIVEVQHGLPPRSSNEMVTCRNQVRDPEDSGQRSPSGRGPEYFQSRKFYDRVAGHPLGSDNTATARARRPVRNRDVKARLIDVRRQGNIPEGSRRHRGEGRIRSHPKRIGVTPRHHVVAPEWRPHPVERHLESAGVDGCPRSPERDGICDPEGAFLV